ncbi:autotransporter-associated beta strand protein [Bradyrhizobium sp. LM2.7]
MKLGTGWLLLTGSNTYGGGTVIAGGTLAIVSSDNLGSAGSPISLSGGGALATFADITTSGAMTIGDAGTIYTYGGTTLTASGAISGAGALTKDGGGTLALTGANNYGGGTNIAGGTLQLGNGGTAGSIAGDVVNHGTFAFNRSDAYAFGGTISGTGAVAQIGAGTTILTGANTYTGNTFVEAGTLQLGNGSTSGSITGNVLNNGTLAFNRSDTTIFAGLVAGTGSLTQAGTGTTTLTVNNTYSGGTTISAGTLQLGNGGTAGSIIGNVVNNGALIVNRADEVVLDGAISGTGSFAQNGPGTTRLDGNSSYSGATDVMAGKLGVNGSIASSSLVTVHAGATLGGNGIVGTTQINAGGMLAPGNSIGLLTVQGNLSFAAASSYMVEVSGPSADRTNVTGIATLNGATVRATFDRGSYVSKQYTIVNAAGGTNGTFAGQVDSDLPSAFASSLRYDAQNVYLDLTLSMAGLNVNQQNVANGLNKYFDANGGIPLAFGALSPEGLTQVSGELATAVPQTTIQAMTQFMGVITDPFSGNRGGTSLGATPFGETVAFNAYASTDGKRSGSERDAYGIITKVVPRAATFEARWNVWAAGLGGGQTTEGNADLGSNTASSRVGGVAVGADYWLSPQTVAAFALAGGGTNFSLSNGLGSGRSDLFQAGAFVRHSVGSVYATAAIAYGWQDITTDRTVTMAGIDRLRAHFNANAFSARAEAGNRSVVPLLGGVGLTPYVAGQVTNFDLPAYAESVVSGANVFVLSYASKNVTAARSELGLRSDKSWALGEATLTMRGRAAWAHDYNMDRTVAATFQSLPGASFVVNGAAQASDSALATASSEITFSNGISIAATYEGEFSRVTRSHAGKGVVRYVW